MKIIDYKSTTHVTYYCVQIKRVRMSPCDLSTKSWNLNGLLFKNITFVCDTNASPEMQNENN